MINLEKGGKNARTLLGYLPEIAGKSQQRFCSNFQTLLLHAHSDKDDKTDWRLCRYLQDVISLAKEYGKLCQIFQLNTAGPVVEL